ncbi:Type 1 glutamine amidotransferase-like domain-containing protein [Paraconexibacter sp.]|uniref:Type 1 glutamine amidotransferase-like domain-containing protein n=1 Tax=Paraconexibacter sp. TaxID=2949640 RepID=UPI003564FD5F
MRTIFAMGGGGFTMEPENPALDEFILSLAPRREPKLLFLPTAGGDSEGQIARFYATFSERPCEPAHLSLFRLGGTGPVHLRDLVLSQDIVFVGGGSMRLMLAIWREYKLDRVLREAWERGVVLAGLSAGAMCWFAGGVTTSTGVPEPAEGLGLLPGSLSVHADGEPDRLPVYREAIRAGALPAGYAADDGCGLLFRGETCVRAVSSRPEARAWRIERTSDGDVEHTPLLPTYLPHAGREERSTPPDVLEFRQARRRRIG